MASRTSSILLDIFPLQEKQRNQRYVFEYNAVEKYVLFNTYATFCQEFYELRLIFRIQKNKKTIFIIYFMFISQIFYVWLLYFDKLIDTIVFLFKSSRQSRFRPCNHFTDKKNVFIVNLRLYDCKQSVKENRMKKKLYPTQKHM